MYKCTSFDVKLVASTKSKAQSCGALAKQGCYHGPEFLCSISLTYLTLATHCN